MPNPSHLGGGVLALGNGSHDEPFYFGKNIVGIPMCLFYDFIIFIKEPASLPVTLGQVLVVFLHSF